MLEIVFRTYFGRLYTPMYKKGIKKTLNKSMETTVQVEWLIKAAFKNPTKHYKTIQQNIILIRSGEGVQIAAILL